MVDDIADVHVFENVLGYDVVEVGLHELENDIDIAVVLRLYGFVEFDDVRVLNLTQDLYLPIGPLRISGVLEGVEYFFQGKNLFGCFLFDLPDMSVGPRPDFLHDVKSSMDVVLDIRRLARVAHTLSVCYFYLSQIKLPNIKNTSPKQFPPSLPFRPKYRIKVLF